MSQKFVKTVLVSVLAVAFQNDEKSNEAIAELVGDKMEDSDVTENVLTINFKTTKVDKKDVTPEPLVLNHEDFLVKDEDGNLSVMTPQALANDYSIAR
jgi:hypothetical protein